MDVRVAGVAEAHDGLVPWAALLDAGMSRWHAARAVADLRRIHDGVFLTGHGRVTDHQRWLAATLTAPQTALSHASAGACWGFRPWTADFEVATRPGSGGPRRIGALLVCRSTALAGETTTRDGIPITTPARTLVDLAAHLTRPERAKAVREAIRLGVMTASELQLAAIRHRGRRGTRGLLDLATRLGRLPIARTRSDAEARALEVLDAAGLTLPDINVHVAGEEADLVWPLRRRLIEIDGPQFHLDAAEDARKEAAWRSAGWAVDRIPSATVFDDPAALVRLAERPPSRT